MGDGLSPWMRALLGLVPLLMAVIILGALAGFVPTGDGKFLAPAWVIASIGAGLMLFALAVWIPGTAPKIVRSGLGLLLFVLVAIVCNWTAFAPGSATPPSSASGPYRTAARIPQVAGSSPGWWRSRSTSCSRIPSSTRSAGVAANESLAPQIQIVQL